MSSSSLTFRNATRDDLESIVGLIADDELGATREKFVKPFPVEYVDAFSAIDSDANNELIVATRDNEVVGVLQITYTPNLTYVGSWRASVEGVRVCAKHRGSGLGTELMRHAIERAKERGCRLIQLTSDLKRGEAIEFYKRLGFQHSYAGMKLTLV